jgi:hypothetical protein
MGAEVVTELLTPGQVAEVLGYSGKQVWRRVAGGKLPAVRSYACGVPNQFRPADVAAFMRSLGRDVAAEWPTYPRPIGSHPLNAPRPASESPPSAPPRRMRPVTPERWGPFLPFRATGVADCRECSEPIVTGDPCHRSRLENRGRNRARYLCRWCARKTAAGASSPAAVSGSAGL